MGKIDIEYLDSLPYRERLTARYGHAWELRKHYRQMSPKYKQVNSIFYNSVGRPMDSLQRRLKPLVKHTFKGSYQAFLQNRINNPDVFNRYVLSNNSSWINRCYYIDENNKLAVKDLNIYCSKNRIWGKTNFDEQQLRKKLRGQKEKELSSILLKVINNRDLFDYITNVFSDEQFLQSKIPDAEKALSDKILGYTMRWDFYSRHYYQDKVNNYKKELIIQQQIISRIKQGDYSDYYNSPNYIRSLTKECHHFEIP